MTARQLRLSSHYLVAELASFLFASEASFEIGEISIDPKLKSLGSQKLWRAAERQILGAVPSTSIDEFVNLRDKLWFESGSDSCRKLLDILRKLATLFLSNDGRPSLIGSDFVGHDDAREQHARALWKWLKLAMPCELLMAARDGGPRPRVLAPSLEGRLQDAGFAETHLHVGAGLDFAQFWALSCGRFLDASSRPDMFGSPGADFDEGRNLAPWILRACIARYILCKFLARRDPEGSFGQFVERELFDSWSPRTTESIRSQLGYVRAETILQTLTEVRLGRFLDSEHQMLFHDLRQCLIALRRLRIDDYTTIQKHGDPICDWHASPSPSLQDAESAEIGFSRQAFSYIDECQRRGKDDEGFLRLFWQSTRIRGILYRHVVQRPLTPGLMWFVRTFSRMSPAKRNIGWRVAFGLAAQTSGLRIAARSDRRSRTPTTAQGVPGCEGGDRSWTNGLESLEIRTAPDGSVVALLDEMLKFISPPDGEASDDEASDAQCPAEFGLVLHFPRDRGGGMREGNPTSHGQDSEADPGAARGAYGARFGRWYRAQRVHAYGLAEVIRSFPSALTLIRGLDVCADEVGIPTWVAKPLIMYVKQVASKVAQHVGREDLHLRMTAHAGEDWLHLVGGLRRIHEAIEHFDMHAGDRLGHAMALGVDADRWARETGPIAMTVEERLFDLAWAWRRSSSVRAQAEPEMRRLLTRMFEGQSVDAWGMVEFVSHLFDVDDLRAINYPEVARQRTGRFGLLVRYLTDAEVFRRGREIIHVDPMRERDLVVELQQQLHHDVARAGLVVEINPSSNFLTSQLSSLREHPAWRLRAPRGDTNLPRVAVVIGSDDPLPFATTLVEEYQLMHDALVLEGLTTEEADRWIEDARRDSMLHRWTRPSRQAPRRLQYQPVKDEVPLPP
jgi:hypothetical protein